MKEYLKTYEDLVELNKYLDGRLKEIPLQARDYEGRDFITTVRWSQWEKAAEEADTGNLSTELNTGEFLNIYDEWGYLSAEFCEKENVKNAKNSLTTQK